MNVEDFEQFMVEVHGHRPFPWQSRIVDEIIGRGSWPSLVDVPTGLGKTSLLDVAVFVLALSAGGEAPEHLGRRRMYLVVDRRIVVDQAHEHGVQLASALENPSPGTVVAEVAKRLRALAGLDGEHQPLRVVRMRGGVTWDSAWLPRPDLPAIITGTVDQVGSRLLFRGYGVSARRRSVDAALVGTDSVIFVDEAHLSKAFTATVDSASELDASEVVGLPGTSVVHLTATSDATPRGWIAGFDEAAHLDNDAAARRLQAPKRLTVLASSDKTLVTDMVGRVHQLLDASLARHQRFVDGVVDGNVGHSPVPRILVVCNTVDKAREVYEAVSTRRRGRPEVETMLLIGRSRPVDRESVVDRVTRLFGADRPPGGEAAVLVATQTIEVGVDLDATDMVTQMASWDALVQRFGRVNRRGAWMHSDITVVDDQISLDEKKHQPPVYGAAQVATAGFLRAEAQGGMDVSPVALRRMQVPQGVSSSPPVLPVLMPAQLDAWVRTSPAPANDPPLDPYLHGIDRSLAPVSVAWRDGLVCPQGERIPILEAAALLDAVPVLSEEQVEIPLGALVAWLSGSPAVSVSDVDDFGDIPFADDSSLLVLRRTWDDTWQWAEGRDIRPGDTVVVPTRYGGLDEFGWNPQARGQVVDVGELTALRRGRPVIRIDDLLGVRLGIGSIDELTELARSWRHADEPDTRAEIGRDLTDQLVVRLARDPDEATPWTRDDREQLRSVLVGGIRISETREQGGVVVVTATGGRRSWQLVEEDSPGGTSNLSRSVTLAAHLQAVGQRADDISRHMGLPESLRRVVVDAARWHDLGKVDPRFQTMLHGGSSIAAELAEEPLAKSGMPPGDDAQFRRALRLSGMPPGGRHEAWSQELVQVFLQGREYPGDRELLLHLVASHHGRGRPLLPPVVDDSDIELEALVDDEVVHVRIPAQVRIADADRFSKLNSRYGRWGLALLETIVRCADMTISSEGS